MTAIVIGAALAVTVGVAPAHAATTVSGKVQFVNASGVSSNVAGIEVDAISARTGLVVAITYTDAASNFVLTLEPGTYQLRFANFGSPLTWYSATGPVYQQSSAEYVEVPSTPISGIQGSITASSTFSGTVLPGVAVNAFRFNSTLRRYESFGLEGFGNPAGLFNVGGLAPGDYLFRAGGGPSNLSNRYFGEGFVGEPYISRVGTPFLVGETPTTYIGYALGGLRTSSQTVTRLAGVDRYGTSAAIAREVYGTAVETAFLVSGRSFADALSAGPVAGLLDVPVLLTEPGALPPATADALNDLAVSTVYIIGGTASVSQAVEDSLLSDFENVTSVVRIAGDDRYETSRDVASTFFGVDGLAPNTHTAYVATGTGFADALAAGPAAGNNQGPLILVPGTATSVDDPTATVIGNLGVQQIVIAGGTSTVSAQMEQSLFNLPTVRAITRDGGTDRYETAVLLNQGSFDLSDAVYLATGSNFPDALSGAAAASSPFYRGPVYLVPSNCVPWSVLNEIARYNPEDIFLLGGEATLSAAVQSLTPCVI